MCPLQFAANAAATCGGLIDMEQSVAGGELGAGARGGRGAGEHPQPQGGAAGALGGHRRRARRGGTPAHRRGDHGACMMKPSGPRSICYPVQCRYVLGRGVNEAPYEYVSELIRFLDMIFFFLGEICYQIVVIC